MAGVAGQAAAAGTVTSGSRRAEEGSARQAAGVDRTRCSGAARPAKPAARFVFLSRTTSSACSRLTGKPLLQRLQLAEKALFRESLITVN